MTYPESDHIFPTALATNLERQIMHLMAEIFRQEHGDARAIPKYVSRRTGIPTDTIRKWKNAKNPPCLGHFLIIAKFYPDVLNTMLELIGCTPALKERDIIPAPQTGADNQNFTQREKIYHAKYCTINLSLPLRIANDLNHRQLWFLGLLQRGERRKVSHITATWEVSDRMARYDIEALVKQRLIRFRGAKKNGWYEAT